jgi:hypothetical protein
VSKGIKYIDSVMERNLLINYISSLEENRVMRITSVEYDKSGICRRKYGEL